MSKSTAPLQKKSGTARLKLVTRFFPNAMERMRGTRVVYLGTICEARGHDDAMMVPPSYPDVPLTKCNALLCRAQFDLKRTEMPFALLALFALLGRSAASHGDAQFPECPENPGIVLGCCDCCPVGVFPRLLFHAWL